MQCLEVKQPFCSCKEVRHSVRMGEWRERGTLGSCSIMETLSVFLDFVLYEMLVGWGDGGLDKALFC